MESAARRVAREYEAHERRRAALHRGRLRGRQERRARSLVPLDPRALQPVLAGKARLAGDARRRDPVRGLPLMPAAAGRADTTVRTHTPGNTGKSANWSLS